MSRKALFLDRDGIIVQPVLGEAPTSPSDLKIIPEIIKIVKKARDLGYLIIIVSNQPDIALGKISEKTKVALEKKFKDLLNKRDLKVDAIYYCHHHPKGVIRKYSVVCDCQKPKPGLLTRAINKFNIDPSISFMIGDRASDVKAGFLVNAQTILFDPDGLQEKYLKKHKVIPNYKISTLGDINNILNNKVAFILAAGEGKRMLPLTKTTPKPLLKINKKPMIDYVLSLLKHYQFTKLGVNVFYKAEQLESHLKGLNIDIIREERLSGSAGGVLAIANKLKPTSPFLVISSDMMVNFDLKKIYNFHLKQKAIATICCYYRPTKKLDTRKSGQVVFNRKTKRVEDFIERSEKVISHWINSSVYIFHPKILKLIKKNKPQDIAKDLIPKLIKLKKPIFAYPINRKKYYQLGIDTPERIQLVEADLNSGRFKSVTI